MSLFAEASGCGSFGFLIFILIMVLGIRQWCKWLKGNDALRGRGQEGRRCHPSQSLQEVKEHPMPFADSFGDLLITLLIGGCLLVFFVVKIVAAVDDDGEIKKTASEGFAACIKRLFK